MGYNALDIIDRSIEIQNCRNILLQNVLNEADNIPNKKICSNMVTSQIERKIEYLNELKKALSAHVLHEIDIITYNQISLLISQFNQKTYFLRVNSLREYLDFSLELLYDKQALFIDIKGRIASNPANTNSESYYLIDEILNYIEYQIHIVKCLHI